MPVTEILATALLIDAVVGDPPTVYRRVPHPVAALGHFIAWLERECNAPCRTDAEHIARGGICVIVVVAVAFTTGALVHAIFTDWTGGWLLESVIVSTLFATRSLYEHVQAVAVGLESGLAAGRRAVSHIVGRDPQALDEEAIARAAIESTAENFSDGVVAPVFWYVVGGLPGLCAYKAINTMDSMLGHRNSQFELFGKCAARLDDAVNWLPARLSAVMLCAAAAIVPQARSGAAVRAVSSDARRHRSPNAGWPEAAMAGALGLALAGPRRYDGELIEDAWMGDGRSRVNADDIRQSLRLYVSACWLTGLSALLVTGLVG